MGTGLPRFQVLGFFEVEMVKSRLFRPLSYTECRYMGSFGYSGPLADCQMQADEVSGSFLSSTIDSLHKYLHSEICHVLDYLVLSVSRSQSMDFMMCWFSISMRYYQVKISFQERLPTYLMLRVRGHYFYRDFFYCHNHCQKQQQL